MFNVTITFDTCTNKTDDFINRITKARTEIFDSFIKDGVIQDFTEDNNRIAFRVSYGGTDRFLEKLSNIIWHFRVLDKKSQITLQAVPAM